MSNLERLVYKSKGFIKSNTPMILTCIGAAGVIATSLSTAKATPKALFLLEQAEKERKEDLTIAEKIKIAGPVYIPSILLGAATISCMFSAHLINKSHQKALIGAYTVLDQSYKEYKNKVQDIYGEDANKVISEGIAKDKYKNNGVKEGEGTELFYDEYSKRYFWSTTAKVQRAEYEVNRNLVMRDYLYLNEWFESLGLDEVDNGYELGWSTGMCLDMYWQAWIDFAHNKITLDDGQECTAIVMLEEPIPGFADY